MGISRVFRTVSGIVLGLATCIGMSGQTAPTTKGEATQMSIQEVHVQRVNIVTTEPFDTVVARIDIRSQRAAGANHISETLQTQPVKPLQ